MDLGISDSALVADLCGLYRCELCKRTIGLWHFLSYEEQQERAKSAFEATSKRTEQEVMETSVTAIEDSNTNVCDQETSNNCSSTMNASVNEDNTCTEQEQCTQCPTANADSIDGNEDKTKASLAEESSASSHGKENVDSNKSTEITNNACTDAETDIITKKNTEDYDLEKSPVEVVETDKNLSTKRKRHDEDAEIDDEREKEPNKRAKNSDEVNREESNQNLASSNESQLQNMSKESDPLTTNNTSNSDVSQVNLRYLSSLL